MSRSELLVTIFTIYMTLSMFNFENFKIINKYLKMTKTVTCSSKEELNCFFLEKKS